MFTKLSEHFEFLHFRPHYLDVDTIFRKAPPSVVSGYTTFEKHIFLSQTDLTRTGIISNSYNETFEA